MGLFLFFIGGACGVTVITIRNELSYPSSNPEQGFVFHITLILLGVVLNPTIFLPAMSK